MVDYESHSLLEQYLLFHYGTEKEILPYEFGPKEALHFPQRCVKWCKNFLTHKTRALDLGCAVGGATFELAKTFQEVIGIDYSNQFIAAAMELQRLGELSYTFRIEGDITQSSIAKIEPTINRKRIFFQQGDASRLDIKLGKFDLVLMLNLIDRLKQPEEGLRNLLPFIEAQGLLVIASPYTWLETITPKNHWLGGYYQENQSVFTSEALFKLLEGSFELLKRDQLPFLIREHARKFQWNVSEVTLWKRK